MGGEGVFKCVSKMSLNHKLPKDALYCFPVFNNHGEFRTQGKCTPTVLISYQSLTGYERGFFLRIPKVVLRV